MGVQVRMRMGVGHTFGRTVEARAVSTLAFSSPPLGDTRCCRLLDVFLAPRRCGLAREPAGGRGPGSGGGALEAQAWAGEG